MRPGDRLMEHLARLRDVPQRVWIGAAGAVIIAVMAALPRILFGEGELRYSGIPTVRLPVPPVSGTSRSGSESTGETQLGAPSPGAPQAVDPALLEDGVYGPLPRVSPDGRRPATVYARAFEPGASQPRIAILVIGLGLQAAATDAALALPAAVTLQFSPYAPDLPALLEKARRDGHEVMLELPMEPLDFPDSDPGPHTLLADASVGANLDRLSWILGQAAGYFGVSGSGRRFTRSPQAEPILAALAERGLALVEIGTRDLEAIAAELDLPYAPARAPIDDDPSALAIDEALAELEGEALATGSAIGVAQTYPISFERLSLWIASLADKGIALAPVSAVVIEQSGLGATSGGDESDLALSRSG